MATKRAIEIEVVAAQKKGRSLGYEDSITLEDLPDSLLEHIIRGIVTRLREAAQGKQTQQDSSSVSAVARFLLCVLAPLSKRFRRIVFNGCLWSAEDLSSIFSRKNRLGQTLATLLSRLDLTKVNFFSDFTFPSSSIHMYSEQDICSLFDIFGRHIRYLRVSNERGSQKQGIAVSDYKKIEEILRRCQSLEFLDIDMYRATFDYSTLIKTLPLKHLGFGLAEVSHISELIDTLAVTWPGLQTLNLSYCSYKGHTTTVSSMAPVSLKPLRFLSALTSLRLSDFPFSDVAEMFSMQSLTTVHLKGCSIGMATLEKIPPNSVLQNLIVEFCSGVSSVNIKNCSSLENLHLARIDNEHGSVIVAQCRALKSLVMTSLSTNSSHIDITECPNLQELHLFNCFFKDSNIERFQQLHSLDISLHHDFYDIQGFLSRHISKSCLKSLTISLVHYAPTSLDLVLPELKELKLKGYSVFSSVVTVNCPKLQTLEIFSVTGRCSKKIATLDLSGCTSLQSVDIDPICTENVPLVWLSDLLTRNPELRTCLNMEKLRRIIQQGPNVDQHSVHVKAD